MKKAIVIENHPADSRVKIKDDGICQSLTSRMGTGGGNVPLILAIHEADGQDVTMMEETAYALVTSGGKPGWVQQEQVMQGKLIVCVKQ